MLIMLFLNGLTYLASSGALWATDHYAAPYGRSTADGSISNPWDLDTALGSPSGSPPGSIKPGDTIWLRTGTYRPRTKNGYLSHLNGSAASPIVVRNYNGEHVTLDGGTDAFVLGVYGSYVWYWGLEVISSNIHRYASLPGSAYNPIAYGVAAYGSDNKFINLVVHDTAQGFSAYNAAPNCEFYGNIVYYNGWVGPDRTHGDGVYMQNGMGTKLIQDNFIGDNADQGIQLYGSGSASLIGITVDNNSIYDSGSWPIVNYQYNLLLGGGQTQTNNTITSNRSYFPPSTDQGYISLGIYTPGNGLTATGNIFIGGYFGMATEGMSGPYTFGGNTIYVASNASHTITLGQFSGQTLAGYSWDNNAYYGLNAFYRGTYDGYSESNGSTMSFPEWQSNTGLDAHSTFQSSAPTGKWIFVRPNKYEAKRASITIYNWDLSSTVSVNLSGVLRPGDRYVIQDAQDFYGKPVVSGTYSGGSVSIPMTGLTKAIPTGFSAPVHTAPSFGTFVVMLSAKRT
jgi:hypothetical protein